MKNAFRGAAVLTAAAALALTGCSNPSVPDSSTQAGAAEWPAVDSDLSGVTLTIWGGALAPEYYAGTIEKFEAATGAQVEVVVQPDPYEQTIQTKVATGDMPDLANWQPTGSQLSALNASKNLQVLDGAPWLDTYNEGLRDITGILDDKRYAALISTPAIEGVFYNKEVFAANGVTETPGNWEEFVALGRQLKAAGQTPFGEMGDPGWATQWWVQVQLAEAAQDGLWDRINANEEQFTSPTIQGAVDEYKSLIDEGLFNADIKTATFDDQADSLLAGDTAMVIQVNSFLSNLQTKVDTAELDQKVGFFPISKEGNVGTFIPDQNNALVAFKTGDPQREAASRQFLSYLMGEGYSDYINETNTVSLVQGVESPDSVPQALLDVAAATPDSVGSMQALAIANPDLYLNLANMIQGTATPTQVTQATQDQFAQLATALGATGF